MKKFTYSVAIAATLLATSSTFAQQGFGTNTPHRSSAVEIKSSNKGFLIPRVTLSNETDVLTIASPAHSLLVFHQGPQPDKESTLPRGYYYWDAEYMTPEIPAVGNQPAIPPQNSPRWVAFSTAEGATYTSDNGIEQTGNHFQLGGDLIKPTKLVATSTNYLAIEGLQAANKFDTGNFYVMLSHDYTEGTGATAITHTGVVKKALLKDVVMESVKTSNGIVNEAIDPDGTIQEKHIMLGGALNRQTVISTSDNTFALKTGNTPVVTEETPYPQANPTDGIGIRLHGNAITTGEGENAVTLPVGMYFDGLEQHTVTQPEEGESIVTDFAIVVTDDTTNQVKTIRAEDIVSAGVLADNGLTKDGNTIQLGGELLHNTTIGTKDYNLAINNLQNASTGNKRVLIERVTTTETVTDPETNAVNTVQVTRDVLRTVERNITVTNNVVPTDSQNYEEITFEVNQSGDLVLPDATLAKGQVINVVIKSNDMSGLLVIRCNESNIEAQENDIITAQEHTDAGTGLTTEDVLSYGEMLGQRWTLKSDGAKWIITSRM